jgi:phospholipase C
VDPDLVDGKALLGCRVPTLIVSPFARGNPAKPRINSLLFDHTSVLKLIEWRWNIKPLGSRDASDEIANLASALDFTSPNVTVPELPVIPEPAWDPCTFFDIFESLDATGGVPNVEKAMALAQAKQNTGQDNETYDFYLLLKSERMQGWPLSEKLKAK